MLKSPSELKKLSPESSDIYKRNVLNRYIERPELLDNLCLADFVALYNFRGNKSSLSDESNDLNQDTTMDADLEIDDSMKSITLSDGVLRRRKQPKIIRFCRFNLAKDPHNFFRERLMLFKPWRNESVELEEIDPEQIYLQNINLIKENSRNYIKEDSDLELLSRAIENGRENQTDDAEGFENDEDSEESSVINVFDYPDNTMQADIMFEIGLGHDSSVAAMSGTEFNKLTIPEVFSNKDYIELMASLNEKQFSYVIHVLSSVKSNEMPFYHFVGGEAGVGKSKLITAIYQSLSRYYKLEPGPLDSVPIMICAYTGKAAHNIGGVTAHNAFLLSIKNHLEVSNYRLTAEKLNNLRVKFAKLKVIIIDEVSLFGRRTFEKLNERLKEIFQTDRLFGGITIIVLGHFGQLRPVKDDFIFASSGNGIQRMIGNLLWEPFEYYELTEIMRQKNDLLFAEALSRMSIGIMNESDVELFRSRCYTESSLPPNGKAAVRLMWRNAEVAEYNNRRLNELSCEDTIRIEYRAIDQVVGSVSKNETQTILHNLDIASPNNTQGLAKTLILQIGIRYMVTTNVDVSDGLFNGAISVLKFVEFLNGKAETLYMEFEDPSIGKNARALKDAFYRVNPDVNKNWTPIQRQKSMFKVTKKGIGQV